MAPSRAEKLQKLYREVLPELDVADLTDPDRVVELRTEVDELRAALRDVGKPDEYSDRATWQRAVYEALYVTTPALIDAFAEGDDAHLATKLAELYSAVVDVRLTTQLGGVAPSWAAMATTYRGEPDVPGALPSVDGEWWYIDGTLAGTQAPLGAVAEAQAAGRVWGERALVSVNGEELFVKKGKAGQWMGQQVRGTGTVPSLQMLQQAGVGGMGAPGTQWRQSGAMWDQLAGSVGFGGSQSTHQHQRSPGAGSAPENVAPLQSAGIAPPSMGGGYPPQPPGVGTGSWYPQGFAPPGPGATQGWAMFANSTGIKPDHNPNAPHVLRLIASGGGSGAGTARAFVAAKYGHLHGGPEYEALVTNATLLDGRMAQMGTAPLAAIEADSMVEILCSELASMDFLLRSGDAYGAGEMRATLGAEAYVAGAQARSKAVAATKSASQHLEHKRQAARGAKGAVRGRIQGKGAEPAGAGIGNGMGNGNGQGGVECHRCGLRGHPARLCRAPEPKQ